MKKVLLCIFCTLFMFSGRCAEIVNVEYIHNAIADKWYISIPYSPELDDPRIAANMKYLLTTIDIANQILNGGQLTDYGNGEFATMHAADTIATDTAIETLITAVDYSFFITTTPNTSSFSLKISASGTFYIDWGDGDIDTIQKLDTTNTTYSHSYEGASTYDIRIGGRATGYSTVVKTAAISFSGNKQISAINGSLGAIFPTISNRQQPRFYQTFNNCTNMSCNIPVKIFSGISGKPATTMFTGVFANCTGLTGEIPPGLFGNLSGAPSYQLFNNAFLNCSGLTGSIPGDLFSGINGPPTDYLFDSTFSGCSGLTGSIPAGLFAGISGSPVYGVFYRTFSGCSGLTGKIPENLFSGIYGVPAGSMFYYTFYKCTGLTSIPENLFGDISGSSKTGMFGGMFSGCSNLSGPSARINGEYLYNIWPDATDTYIGDMYYNATGLFDYSDIPVDWK